VSLNFADSLPARDEERSSVSSSISRYVRHRMKVELPRDERLLIDLEADGSELSRQARQELIHLYSVRDDYFAQIIEQCDQIDELERKANGG
jgi:hypothetical protein